jgi:hypothetical protein
LEDRVYWRLDWKNRGNCTRIPGRREIGVETEIMLSQCDCRHSRIDVVNGRGKLRILNWLKIRQ